MPFIQVRLSVSLDGTQKNDLQGKLSNAVSAAFSKPQAYIMSEIEGGCSLFMNGKTLEKGAYISVSLLGNASKPACSDLTKTICDILSNDFGISGSSVYVTYHPTELWGWNGMMF